MASIMGGGMASIMGGGMASIMGGGMASIMGGGMASIMGGGMASIMGGGMASIMGGGMASIMGGGMASKIGGGMGSIMGGGMTSNMAAGAKEISGVFFRPTYVMQNLYFYRLTPSQYDHEPRLWRRGARGKLQDLLSKSQRCNEHNPTFIPRRPATHPTNILQLAPAQKQKATRRQNAGSCFILCSRCWQGSGWPCPERYIQGAHSPR
uniref:Uncharacterized protein n=1 Tax=Xenopus tropicalis TaxID=8364 RepID=A0A1B8Y1D7_XENTR